MVTMCYIHLFNEYVGRLIIINANTIITLAINHCESHKCCIFSKTSIRILNKMHWNMNI